MYTVISNDDAYNINENNLRDLINNEFKERSDFTVKTTLEPDIKIIKNYKINIKFPITLRSKFEELLQSCSLINKERKYDIIVESEHVCDVIEYFKDVATSFDFQQNDVGYIRP